MYYVRHWPLLAVTVSAMGGLILLLWILFHLYREGQTGRRDGNSAPPGTTTRNLRR